MFLLRVVFKFKFLFLNFIFLRVFFVKKIFFTLIKFSHKVTVYVINFGCMCVACILS